jgi:hypothetical protein
MSAIDPESGLVESLKTRMLKKELAQRWCSVAGLGREADAIQTVEIEIHCHAAVFDNHLLKCPLALTFGICFVAPKAFGRRRQ